MRDAGSAAASASASAQRDNGNSKVVVDETEADAKEKTTHGVAAAAVQAHTASAERMVLQENAADGVKSSRAGGEESSDVSEVLLLLYFVLNTGTRGGVALIRQCLRPLSSVRYPPNRYFSRHEHFSAAWTVWRALVLGCDECFECSNT